MPPHILLVDDNPRDISLFREALKEDPLFGTDAEPIITVAHQGEKALRVLHKLNPKPHMIVLDLNLPGISGFEVLRAIRSDPHPLIQITPVIVLSCSSLVEHINEAYRLHCNAYIKKPIGFDNLIRVVKYIVHFWTYYTCLPRALPITTLSPPPPSSSRYPTKV